MTGFIYIKPNDTIKAYENLILSDERLSVDDIRLLISNLKAEIGDD